MAFVLYPQAQEEQDPPATTTTTATKIQNKINLRCGN